MKIFKLVFLCLLVLIAGIVFWPYAIGGIFAFFFSAKKFNHLVSPCVALCVVSLWRFITGQWPIRIGDAVPEHWYYEILPGILSWVLATIFVSAFTMFPAKFLEGYRCKFSTKRESEI